MSLIRLPSLEIQTTLGPINLSAYVGHQLVVYFYPKDDTPGCTAQACSIRDGQEALLAAQVNVIGIMEATQALLPSLAPNAHIVNISSMGGFQGSLKFAGLAAYSTSKAALCAFTELFAEEYKHTNIHMNCLCLGAVQTEMLAAAFPGYTAPTTPTEMADFIANFALHSGAFFNGKILPVSSTNP